MNTDVSWPTPQEAEARVLGIQTKLHHWATNDPGRRFDDLFNLICDPAFLLVGWRRVKGNKGARTAGVDGRTALYVTGVRGEAAFLADLRAELKARTFRPLPVAERLIPKPGGSKRRLGSRRWPTGWCRPRSSWCSSRSSRRTSNPAPMGSARAARPGRHRRDPPPHQPTGWL